MKKISVKNYRTDKYYSRVTRAVHTLLSRSDVVTAIDLLIELGMLEQRLIGEWRLGRVPYLEKVIHCNLAVASRILRLLSLHAHDLGLRASETAYFRHGRGPKARLQFSKSREPALEAAYARHFIRGPSKVNQKPVASEPEPFEEPSAECNEVACAHDVKRMLAGLIASLPETERYMRKVPATRRRLDGMVAGTLPDAGDGTRIAPFR